jgi:hypothetical protein
VNASRLIILGDPAHVRERVRGKRNSPRCDFVNAHIYYFQRPSNLRCFRECAYAKLMSLITLLRYSSTPENGRTHSRTKGKHRHMKSSRAQARGKPWKMLWLTHEMLLSNRTILKLLKEHQENCQVKSDKKFAGPFRLPSPLPPLKKSCWSKPNSFFYSLEIEDSFNRSAEMMEIDARLNALQHFMKANLQWQKLTNHKELYIDHVGWQEIVPLQIFMDLWNSRYYWWLLTE